MIEGTQNWGGGPAWVGLVFPQALLGGEILPSPPFLKICVLFSPALERSSTLVPSVLPALSHTFPMTRASPLVPDLHPFPFPLRIPLVNL